MNWYIKQKRFSYHNVDYYKSMSCILGKSNKKTKDWESYICKKHNLCTTEEIKQIIIAVRLIKAKIKEYNRLSNMSTPRLYAILKQSDYNPYHEYHHGVTIGDIKEILNTREHIAHTEPEKKKIRRKKAAENKANKNKYVNKR